MKKNATRLVIAAGVIAVVAYVKINTCAKELSAYYLNIRVLGPSMGVESTDADKGKAQRFLYGYSSRVVIAARKQIISKIASDWIESKNAAFTEDRVRAERYVANNDRGHE